MLRLTEAGKAFQEQAKESETKFLLIGVPQEHQANSHNAFHFEYLLSF